MGSLYPVERLQECTFVLLRWPAVPAAAGRSDARYINIDAYIAQHRPVLLAAADDPETFFVKAVKRTSRDAAYDSATFCEACRLIIQRYGIYNPYEARGDHRTAAAWLAQRPRCHVLNTTESFEQASCAIEDTLKMVAQHYGRFFFPRIGLRWPCES